MTWHVAGLVWIVQIFFWGFGLTLLIMPRRWRRFWPAFCAPVGLALQSLVVWVGTHTPLPGTDSYAFAALVIPVGLALAAWRQERGRGGIWRRFTGARRWWPVAVVMAASLSLQAYPFTKPPGVLTSAAIGSCDAADYAAGARVFKEFSRHDRSGFLGNTDLAGALPVDGFYDFWLRLNHFSPSAFIALHASLCGRQPYELTSLLGIVLLTLGLPGVFWLARSAFRFGPAGSLAVTSTYAFSPIVFYAVYQTALGQLMAAQAVALLTWAGWQAYRGPKTWRRLAGWSGPLLIGDWLLFGGYNFFILFAYVPLFAYVGLRTLQRRDWPGASRWIALVGANVLVCAVLFPGRVMSIVERFRLFNQTPFGWSIPGFWPSGWYGLFADATLHATSAKWAVALTAAVLAATAASALRRDRWRAALLGACCTLPIFFGYWYLLRADRLRHDHSSYDAFKLFTVFYPGILISLCLFLRGLPPGWPWRVAAGALWAALLVVNVQDTWRFNAEVRKTPLLVDHDLAALAEIERMPEVASVNVTMVQVWDELWANYFLLHKPQYFAHATYEGRVVTPLRGQWDLSQRLVSARVDGDGDPLGSSRTYSLVKREDSRFVEVRLGEGWHPTEHYRNDTWCWGKAAPAIRITNPQPGTLAASLGFSVRSLAGRQLQMRAGDKLLWEGRIGVNLQNVDGVPLELPPGTTLVRLDSPEAPDHSPGDPRGFTFMLHRFQIDVHNSPHAGPH